MPRGVSLCHGKYDARSEIFISDLAFFYLTIYPVGVYDAEYKKEKRMKQYLVGGTFMEEQMACCSCKKKERSEKEYKDLINRLSRIEGQVRGVKRMVEEDAYCIDILTQVSAITSALNSFNKVLLAEHIKTCVTDDIRAGKDETVDELVGTLQKLMK